MVQVRLVLLRPHAVLLTRRSAADATSHLFFAYLRSLSPNSGRGASGISILPLSLQTLVQATEYPPNQPMSSPTSKVVMIVDSVSPTPFALLRRAKHFQYRDDDRALQDFSDYEDPVKALTDECQRVLKCISSTNQSTVSTSKASTSLPDASWSRFEDIGFSGFGDYSDQEDEVDGFALVKKRKNPPGLRSVAQSKNHDLGRPTTPSWADFLSSGFVDETNKNGPAPLLLPHDKILPPIGIERGHSSQSHLRKTADDSALEPGELASINTVHFDDAFWWVWISSLAGEETMERKAVFGRCALVETMITGGRWLIMEEIVKGAAPPPEEGAYIAEKKSRFGFSTRGRFTRTKSISKKPPPPPKTDPYSRGNQASPLSKTSIGPDQHARIQAAAAALQEKQKQLDRETTSPRRARVEDSASVKTSSVFTLQPIIISEAAPAMRWANSYDKNAIRAAYLGNNFAGKGSSTDLSGLGGMNNAYDPNDHLTPTTRELPPRPNPNSVNGAGLRRDEFGLSGKGSADGRDLPPLPLNTPSQLASMPPFPEPIVMPSAPLPVATNHKIRVSNEAATQAADVPLPAATPLENAQSMNDKPLPPAGSNYDGAVETAQHEVGSPTLEGADGVSSSTSSPESKKESRKLAKAQGGGFKHFFGKKRPGAPSPSATPQPADSSAIAAARAAYVGPQMKPNYNGSQNTLNRRLSTIGRKKAPMMPSSDSYGVTPVRDSEDHEILTPAPPVAKRFQLHNGYDSSQVSLNRVDTNQQHHVDREFRKFDQGPMMDQPAFVPESSPDHTSPPTPLEPVQDQQSIEQNPTSGKQEHKPSSDKPIEVNDKASIRKEIYHDDSESEDERSASTALDRWAQNRKIAEAARKKEKEPVLVDKTDDGDADGETSGEESM